MPVQLLRVLLATVVLGSLLGCQKEKPPAPVPAAPPTGAGKPFAVKTNDGISHEFYRDVSLQDFLKRLPPGSVDSLDVNLGKGPQVIALVKVPERPGMDLARVRF